MKKKIKVYQYHFKLVMVADFIVWAENEKDAKRVAIKFHKNLIKLLKNNKFQTEQVKDVEPIYL